MALIDRHSVRSALVALTVIVAVSCGARQKADESDSLTDRTPTRLKSAQKEKLRDCVLASAERNHARGYSGNLSSTLQAVRKTLHHPDSRQGRYRARVRDWNLDWDVTSIQTLRVRFGMRGLEVEGEAAQPTDANEFYHRLRTSDELPRLHLREISGNDVDGFHFRFVEETIRDLLRRAPDLNTVYARAREMGVEPVLRDVCPAQDTSPERLPPDDRGNWKRTIRDLPGAWKFSGYKTTESTRGSNSIDASLYTLSEQKDFWQTIEVEFHDDQATLRLGNLIPDGEFEYRAPNPLPRRLQTLAKTDGVEAWAKFDQCPRPLCGLEPSALPNTGKAEIDYLTKLIREIDEFRSQLYDVQAAAWMNGPVQSGIGCTTELLDSDEPVHEISMSFRGNLEFILAAPAEAAKDVESTLASCSSDSVIESRDEVQLRDENDEDPPRLGTRLATNLETTQNLEPEVADYRPRWARRDFVDGAEQLRFLVQQKKDADVANSLERLRLQMRKFEGRFVSRADLLDTFTKSLVAPPFADIDLGMRPNVEIGPDITYRRVELNAEASRTAALQFLILVHDLQEDQLILLEELHWREQGDDQAPAMHATVGVLSRT